MSFTKIVKNDDMIASVAMENWRHCNYSKPLRPVDENGTDSDGVLDLGSENSKWKDVHTQGDFHIQGGLAVTTDNTDADGDMYARKVNSANVGKLVRIPKGNEGESLVSGDDLEWKQATKISARYSTGFFNLGKTSTTYYKTFTFPTPFLDDDFKKIRFDVVVGSYRHFYYRNEGYQSGSRLELSKFGGVRIPNQYLGIYLSIKNTQLFVSKSGDTKLLGVLPFLDYYPTYTHTQSSRLGQQNIEKSRLGQSAQGRLDYMVGSTSCKIDIIQG